MEKFATLEEMQHILDTYGYITNIISEPLWTSFRAQHLSIYDVMGKWLKSTRSSEIFSSWLKEIHPTGTEEDQTDLISFLERKTKYM